MENSTGSISDFDYKSLVNQCLEICSALKDKGCKFSLSLRLGSSLNFSLSSEGCNSKATKKTKRSPSYLRRQIRRRAAFLERNKKFPLADQATTLTPNKDVCRQEEAIFLNKKTAPSWQTAASEVLGKSSRDGGEGGSPPTPPPPPPPPPPPLLPPPPPPPPALSTRRVVFTAGRKRPGISFEQIDGECGPHWLGCSVGSVDELDEQEEEEEANGPPPDAPEDAGGAVALADDAGVVDDDRRREYRRLRLQICWQFEPRRPNTLKTRIIRVCSSKRPSRLTAVV